MASQKTGTSGWLIIEDDGWLVTFKLQNTQSATFANGKSWGGTVNGVAVGGTFSINGVQTITLGSWGVSTTQTVTLSIGATGTSGLGGPSSFSIGIYRATVPAAPTSFTPDQITDTSIRYRFGGNSDGGSPITAWQAQCATDAAFTQNVQTVGSGGTSVFSPLPSATTHYFRSRGSNAVGWGAWSGVVSARTLQQPAAPTVESTAPGQMRVAWVAPPGNGVSNVAGWDMEYADNAGMTGSTVLQLGASASPYTVSNLTPGQQMRVRIRARYSDALGPWSPITTAMLLSGVYASDGFELDPGGMYLSNGAQLVVAQVLYSDGAQLQPAR